MDENYDNSHNMNEENKKLLDKYQKQEIIGNSLIYKKYSLIITKEFILIFY